MIFLSIVLEAKNRDNLKHSFTKGIRDSGYFPAVVYGKDKPNKNIYVEAVNFQKIMREAGRNGVLALKLEDNQKENVMLQDVQTDPLKGEIVHADFYIVDMESEVEADVTITLKGEAQGVKDGGILQQPLHQIAVRALPNDIPETIEIDVSEMEIGDSLQIADLKEARHYEFLDDADTTIVSILPPNNEEKLESGEVQDGGDVQEEEGVNEEETEE